jgi:hypothetical protein
MSGVHLELALDNFLNRRPTATIDTVRMDLFYFTPITIA